MKYVTLIPAYCPDSALTSTVDALNRMNMDTVVVDDGSPNEYQQRFREIRGTAHVLHQVPNQGKGAALKYGMEWIREHYGDCIVVTADADGQHLPADILKCAKAAEENPGTYVLGVRNFHQENVPARSRYGNLITSKLFELSTGTKVSDTQTGLRAFRASLIPILADASGSRYEYEMNALLDMIKEDIPITEVPIETVYEEGNPTSHFHVIRDSFLIYRQLFGFAASSFTAFLIDFSLYSLFTVFLGPAYCLLANICARLISATANYEMNRTLVFHDERDRSESALRYAALAAGILTANTLILFLLTKAGVNAWFAKLVTEIVLFFFSWTMQRNRVFYNRSLNT